MDFDRSTLVDNDYTRDLSEKYERLLQEKNVLEERKQKAHELCQNLNVKSQERWSLEKELVQLANQSTSFSNQSGGLRDVGGTATGPRVENALSWDFEGLNIKEENKPETSAYQEFVTKFIANIEAEINVREIDIELIQKQMTGQLVEKHSNEVPRGYSTDRLQNGTMDQINLATTGGDDISLSPSTKTRELQNLNDLMNKRIEELLENSQQLQNHINVLTKQKEELLQVNHQWDDQYRQLKADKERLASELRKKAGQTREIAQVQRQGPDAAVHEEAKRVIQELAQKNAELGQEVVTLTEEQKKRDKLWTAAKKMISEERAAREAAAQMRQASEERNRQLEAQLEVEKQTQVFLKQEIERLVATVGGSDNTANSSSMVSLNMAEQIEMLKQQISVYADDFANERSDRERIQADREAQKERLKEFEREIALLKEQIRAYRDDFDKERRDKERLQRLLRERSPAQVQQEEPWYMIPPSDYVAMHPVQRRQDRQYRYSPREIQELAYQQQQQQQPLHARGQTGGGHPGGLCHGCEADCDVIDGPVILKCPRCERVFASNERRAFEEHIDKCTT